MTPVMVRKSDNWKSKLKKEWKPLSLLGALGGLTIILQMTALELTLVSYVIAIKRLSIPITIVISYLLLKEKDDFRERIGGSLMMVIGAIIISI
ncbi:MAG: EamA family transporter [Candidatus Nanohaloarchaea archaeon]